jgi:hypothetical protein
MQYVLLMTGRDEPGGLASGEAAKISYIDGPQPVLTFTLALCYTECSIILTHAFAPIEPQSTVAKTLIVNA